MRISGRSGGLLAGCLALAGGFIAWIIHGQVKPNVTVPRPAEWAHVALICVADEVDDLDFADALSHLEKHKQPVRTELVPCDDEQSAIHIRVSDAEVERLYPSSEGMTEYGQMTGRVAPEAFERTAPLGVVTNCNLWLRKQHDTYAIVHGVLHCLGYDDALNAPIGHVMSGDYLRGGLDDWRGIR